MRGKFFLDTNIFVYSFDRAAQEKRDKASALIRTAMESKQGSISYQVIQEFLSVALSRFETPLSTVDAKEYMNAVLLPLCQVYPDRDLYSEALDVLQSTGFSFYDALIVAAAKRMGASRLYTEDLQDGRILDSVTIVNPFA